jgi:hypothetical protein
VVDEDLRNHPTSYRLAGFTETYLEGVQTEMPVCQMLMG